VFTLHFAGFRLNLGPGSGAQEKTVAIAVCKFGASTLAGRRLPVFFLDRQIIRQ
jgi:hypothetical protein